MRTIMNVKTGTRMWIFAVVIWAVIAAVLYYGIRMEQQSTRYLKAARRRCEPSTSFTTTPSGATSPNTSPPTRRQLLLVTYGRTGSSFTSAIISQDPSVFFIFEPLHAFHRVLLQENITEKTQKNLFHVIDAFLQCDFRALDPNLFADWLLQSSKSTNRLFQCLRNKKLSGHSHVGCFLSTWYSCQASSLTFIKFIRFRTEWAEHFLKRHHNLKILFLVRDVRAVLHSQARNFRAFNMTDHPAERAGKFCRQARKDFQIFHRLNSMFPGRVKGIRYEHGCLDPVNYARNIYKFAGLDFNNNTKQFLHNITKSNRTDRDVVNPYSVVRQDAIQTMNYWRQTADFKTVKMIDRNCKGVYSLFGYRPVQSQQELVSNVSLVNPIYKGLFNTFS